LSYIDFSVPRDLADFKAAELKCALNDEIHAERRAADDEYPQDCRGGELGARGKPCIDPTTKEIDAA
jgi:hypothetical protein